MEKQKKSQIFYNVSAWALHSTVMRFTDVNIDNQGDQIGQIFLNLGNGLLWESVLKITELCRQKFWATFSHDKINVLTLA
jgi:hypothetical protein